MFSNYSKQIYKELIKQDFKPFVSNIYEHLNDDTICISLLKFTNDIIYIVSLLNTNNYTPDICMGKAQIDRVKFLEKFSNYDVKFLNIFISNNNESDIKYISKIDENSLIDFKEIFWSVSISDDKIIHYTDKRQPNKLLGIQNIIKNIKVDLQDSEEEQLATITAKAIYESPIRTKSMLFSFCNFIIAINIIVFFMVLITDGLSGQSLLSHGAFSYNRIINQGEYYRIFTSMFLHASFMHLLSNMFTLYIFGRGLESSTSHTCFLAVYFLSGLFANTLMLMMPSNSIMVGASGCIFGVIGATLVLTMYFKKSIYGLTFTTILTLALFNLVISLYEPEISFEVHFIGFLVGMILGYVYALDEKRNNNTKK